MCRRLFAIVCVLSLAAILHAADVALELPPVAVEGQGGYVSGELIYPLENRPTPECHASTIAESNNGLVAAWFAGTEEKDPDVGIWISRHDGKAWSKPEKVVDGSEGEEKEYACWNPVLFQPKDAPLMLFYKVGVSPRLWWGALVTSTDGGQTWSEPRRLGTSDALPAMNKNLLGPVKNKPVMLADGTLLCGSSTENAGWKVHFELTRDLGKTWEVVGPIHDASKFNAIQPTILTHANGDLQILCRSREDVVTQSWSKDQGKTWSAMSATELPNPSAGTDAVTLADGRHLMVFNPTTRGRHKLNVGLTTDGKNWTVPVTLEDQRGEFSYPAIIQAADGKVHITYTWKRQSVKHVVLDPAKIK